MHRSVPQPSLAPLQGVHGPPGVGGLAAASANATHLKVYVVTSNVPTHSALLGAKTNSPFGAVAAPLNFLFCGTCALMSMVVKGKENVMGGGDGGGGDGGGAGLIFKQTGMRPPRVLVDETAVVCQ